jgi:hypothetical protein
MLRWSPRSTRLSPDESRSWERLSVVGYPERMTRILSIIGAVVAVAYKILFDPARQPTPSAWSTWDIELLVMYGAAGLAVGWVLAVIFGKIGRDK